MQTFDGGISESSQHEAHGKFCLNCKDLTLTKLTAGYTYCAIASLSFLDRLPNSSAKTKDSGNSLGLTNLPATIRWLVSRQLQYQNVDEDSEDEGSQFQKRPDALSGIYANIEPSLDNLSIQEDMFVGFNGRTNKRADTCYAFWVGASLAVSIFKHDLVNID